MKSEMVKPDAQFTQFAISFLSSYHPLPPDLAAEIENSLFQTSYKKGEHIFGQGETCSALYFIIKGVVVGYTLMNNKRLTTFICAEMDTVSSISGMYGKKPSGESVLALEDTMLLGLKVEAIVALLERSIEMNIIIRTILEEFYKSAHERSNIVRLGTAKEKYDYYLKQSPQVIHRIPPEYIADYLNINCTTLERIIKADSVKSDVGLIKEKCDLIDDFILKKEGFRQRGLTITKMATELGMTVHQLSHLINSNYNRSFNSFINSHRVIYVRKRLQHYKEWQHLKIEALGVEGGFSSRSVFFSEFKHHTGFSPTGYLKSLQQSSPDL